MASGIGSTAVYLAGILAREGTTTVSPLATIGINDNLATCQTCITVRTTYDKLACGIDEIFDIIAKQGQHFLRINFLLDAWYQNIDDILTNLAEHALIIAIKLVVLSGYYDGVDTLRDTSVAVLDGHLTLCVWT